MNSNVIGIIVCVAMVICGMGAYFIGRNEGIEWVLTHIYVRIGVEWLKAEVKDDKSRSDQTDG